MTFMNTWNVFVTKRARKQLTKLPVMIAALADIAIKDLISHGPMPTGWDIKRMDRDEYRMRLTYRYRMRYRVMRESELEIEVFYIGHRRDAYR